MPTDEKPPKKLKLHTWTEDFNPEPYFDTIESRLRGSKLWVERRPGSLKVVNNGPGEFDVEATYDDDEFTIVAGPWHGHFEDEEQVTACFHWLLTPFYRVVEEKVGPDVVGAWIERHENGDWKPLQAVLGVDCQNLIDGGGPFQLTIFQQAVLRPPKSRPGWVLEADGLPKGSHLGIATETRAASRVKELGLIDPDSTHLSR
jgi:hypothetical protein